jgi:glucose dehydrogenase
MKLKFQFFLVLGINIILWACSFEKDSEGINNSWTAYRGDFGNNAYSKQAQINIRNVQNLELAWVYRTGVPKLGDYYYAFKLPEK